VAINYRASHEAAADVAATIAADGGRVLLAPADVTDPEAVEAMVTRVEQEWGVVDVLVNNAYPGFQSGSVEDTEWDVFQRYLDQMLRGAYHTVRAVLPGMKAKRWGRIVNLGTTAMYALNPRMAAYATVKGALLAFTRTLARDLGAYNVCVNMVTPGSVYKGPLPQPTDLSPAHAARAPLGRIATSWEVAGAVVFFASPLSDGITGAHLPVSAGALMHTG
jgi:3-oxoacyl-[acyl-carrier protein] reductase